MSAAAGVRVAVLDANSIIGLAKGDCFPLVARIFDTILVPPAVTREITDPVSHAQLVAALGDWLEEVSPSPDAITQVPEFGTDADRHALALACDRRPCVILTGDLQLTRKAGQLGIRCVNPPLVVQALAEAGVLSAAGPHLDRMIHLGFGIPEDLYQRILNATGEWCSTCEYSGDERCRQPS